MTENDKKVKVVNTKEMIKENLQGLRDELYENIPTGEVNAFDLIKVIKTHIKRLDNLIDAIE